MGIKLSRLADLLEVETRGQGRRAGASAKSAGLGGLAEAVPGQLSFLSNPAYAGQLATTRASAVIIEAKFRDDCPASKLISANPYLTFARATAIFHAAQPPPAGIHPTAVVHEDASIEANVSIGPNSIIEAGAAIGADSAIGPGCIVGAGCELGPGCVLRRAVVLYPGVRLGRKVQVEANSVIGADGFGYAFDGGKFVKIHHGGSVVIGDEVEIGAGTTIDRGVMDNTVIGRGVKIDNQVQIGHNCVHRRAYGDLRLQPPSPAAWVIGKYLRDGRRLGRCGPHHHRRPGRSERDVARQPQHQRSRQVFFRHRAHENEPLEARDHPLRGAR